MNSITSKASIIPAIADQAAPRSSWLARLGRKLLFAQLRQLKQGELVLIDELGTHRFGKYTRQYPLSATIHVDHVQLYADAAFGGSVGAGEAYIRGLWRCDDLVALIRIFVINREVLNGMDSRWAFISQPFLKLFHLWNDIGNELYELMLDDTMAYSCGIFATPETTLHEASIAKFEAACRKLDLKPTDHLLEIGTGWGGLAIHAAQHYGCRVTTTTISRKQYELAQAKVDAAGLSENGKYDKLVSIEMIEAVGAQYLDTYMAKCSSLLKPDGAMLLQAITIQDQLYTQALKSVDFIQRFIFPGSFIPSVNVISQSLSRVTDFKIFNLEDIGPHYATTLRRWRENLLRSAAELRALGYQAEFLRKWEFYFCYCEAGFAERALGDVQALFVKPDARP
jgi:cyclopropane-fatty-acyl-phospholipid synthase